MTWVSRGLVVAATATLLAASWSASFPIVSPTWRLVAIVTGSVTAVAWAVLGLDGVRRRRLSAAWVAALLLGATGAVLVTNDVPLLLRFAMAKPAFEDVIIERGEAGPDADCPDSVGRYLISYCLTYRSDTFFGVTGGGIGGRGGFAYLPDGPTASATDGRTLQALGGPWFAYANRS